MHGTGCVGTCLVPDRVIFDPETFLLHVPHLINVTQPPNLPPSALAGTVGEKRSGGSPDDSKLSRLLLASSLAASVAALSGQAFADAVTLQWWTNATADPLKGIFQTAADDYHAAHPDVTIQVTPIQNEQIGTKITLALQSDTPPDIYFNQGAHLLADQSESGKVADIADATKSWIADVGTAANNWTVAGKQMGLP